MRFGESRRTMRPDFTKIDWRHRAPTERRRARAPAEAEEWLSPEHIALKSFYTREDLAGLEHLEYAAGIPPYLRGPHSTMYAMRPWTIGSTRAFRRRKSRTRFIAAIWPRGSADFRWHSIWRRSADTTPTTSA